MKMFFAAHDESVTVELSRREFLALRQATIVAPKFSARHSMNQRWIVLAQEFGGVYHGRTPNAGSSEASP